MTGLLYDLSNIAHPKAPDPETNDTKKKTKQQE